MTIAERIAAFVAALPAAERRAPAVVACSGGADSMVLAHEVLALAAAGGIGPVTLVYVDHQLRSGSAEDGQRVADLARAGGGQARTVRVCVDTGAASLEDAARRVRYRALDQVAGELGAALIFVAHTATDQAETVLMRIVRGTGVVGLSGMPARRGKIARPLLGVSRAEVLAEANRLALAWLVDPMNHDPRFTRTRIRHQLMPLLKGENPRVEDALCRLADAAAEQREMVESAADRAGTGVLSAASLRGMEAAAATRAVARAAEGAGLGPLASVHLRAIRTLVSGAAGCQSLDVPGGRAIREYDDVAFEPTSTEPSAGAPVEVAGVGGHRVRVWQHGDRMRPRRLNGRSRKLSDLFADARVPRRARQQARVVVREDDGEIVWAEHVGAAHGSDFRVTLTPHVTAATNKD